MENFRGKNEAAAEALALPRERKQLQGKGGVSGLSPSPASHAGETTMRENAVHDAAVS